MLAKVKRERPAMARDGLMEGFELPANGGDVCLPDIVDSSFSFIPSGSPGEAPAKAAFREALAEFFDINVVQSIK